jgi:hypothetical protein
MSELFEKSPLGLVSSLISQNCGTALLAGLTSPEWLMVAGPQLMKLSSLIDYLLD